MKVRFYHIHKGTRVAVVQGTTILHMFVGEVEEHSEVVFDVEAQEESVLWLRARNGQCDDSIEIEHKSRDGDIDISCQGIYKHWSDA